MQVCGRLRILVCGLANVIKGAGEARLLQLTVRETPPKHAAWKVPVPMGRECQWETTTLRLWLLMVKP